jgi:hypothetical protein
VNGVLVGLMFAMPSLRKTAFGFIVLVMSLAVLLARRRLRPRAVSRWLALAAVALVASIAVWIGDLTRRVCWPSSWLQGHAVWHVGTAIAAAFLYAYLRSEEPA